ncbi:AMP-binding protein [Curvibacter sp. CHRR-16]|uniref:(2,3-dihydroxybenzoyl)adenylate synthase n=1 Tax=Curvibacter sp. CHRR-16 TaxID=2835872 RepID=UPI001BDA630B|nr:AMP-binding protein [Curvibacter sp. CHRR-16]MBT0570237.1 AMP-binding protein [Curvibacter sp. CHRR-16]
MFEDWKPWPAAEAQRYRDKGYWIGQTFNDMLAHVVQQHAQRTALVSEHCRWTYAQLQAQVERYALGFHALGIRAQDKVVVQLPNCAELVAVVFALFRLGALPVFALPPHRQFEIGHFCRHTEAVAYVIADVFAGYDYRQLARTVQASVSSLQHVLVLGDAQEFIDLNQMAMPDTPLPAAPQSDALAFLQLSGGSTGTPKLIPRTHDDYLYSVLASARICALSADSVYMNVIPAAHNFAMSSPGWLGVLSQGGTVVMCPNPSPDVALPWMQREKVTMTALVPPLVPVWLDAMERQAMDLPDWRVLQVGGAAFGYAMAERVVHALPHTVLQQVFGMAEGLVCYTRLDDPLEVILNTQGSPISPDDEVRIVDDEDRPLSDGQAGHLQTRGPYTIRAYYKAAEHNAQAFTHDGFYRTGDIVKRRPDGNVCVEGRAKDQINRGGEKVSAEEVEHQLRQHGAVLDCAIVAMPDVHLGEKSCAFVVRRDDTLRAIELTRFLREQGLAAYKIPDRIEFIAQLPKTPVGKVSKKQLRQAISERLQALSQ